MPIFHFLASTIINFLILKKLIPYLRKIIPAEPSDRGMHSNTKASSGGISFVIIYTIMAIYQGFYLPLFSLPISLVGLIDDKYNISKKVRLIAQILTLLVIILFLRSDSSSIISSLNNNIYIYILLIFCGVGIINFINFMDGIDGLVCGSMIVILFAINGEFHYLLPIIGTLTAFLYFNWYPSKIFMGDAGSLFLGSYLVSLIYSSSNFINITKILLICSPLLIDALVSIIRRLIHKQNIFTPHKLHLYQRLVLNGFSHSKVSSIYIASIAFLSIIYTYYNLTSLIISVLLIIILGIYLDKRYALEFNK
tara:strand:+ start:2276 stop:3202 length:927 start_codon:yes stop_codon:yes gene_type:complete